MGDNNTAKIVADLYVSDLSNANDAVVEILSEVDGETIMKYTIVQLANIKRKSPEKYKEIIEKVDILSNILFEQSGVN